MRLLTDAEPAGLADDLDALLLLRHVADHGWVDASRGRTPLQRPLAFVSDAIGRLASHRLDGTAVISAVMGTPPGQEPAWRLSAAARGRLRRLSLPALGPHGRARLALEWARARGRISSTELVDLTGMQPNHASTLLRSLEDDGHLTPSRAVRTGRGFHYLPV